MKKNSFRLVGPALKDSFKGFSEYKITKLSASLAYYTVFSLGPLLIVIISLCSLFLSEQAVQGNISEQLNSLIGDNAARQIETIIQNASVSGKGVIATVIGFITLLIGATSMFGELQDSMNTIWGVKASKKAGFKKLIADRLLSFGLIATLGFLLLVSLAVTALIDGLGDQLKNMFPAGAVVLMYVVNLAVTIGVVTLLFGVLFKVLPDVELKWKDVWMGALFTAFLFLIGRFLISLYISKSDVGSTYGAAGSLVVLLVWIYYTSIILYFGAAFTKAHVLRRGVNVEPQELAEWDKGASIGEAEKSTTAADDERSLSGQQGVSVKRDVSLLPVRRAGIQNYNQNKKGSIGKALLGLALYFATKNKRLT